MKKILLSGLLLLLFARAFGQAKAAPVFHLNKLSKQDTLLTGWKSHAGDNREWSKPGFDDKEWQQIDPGQDITGFKQLKNAGIGWIRLHIRADSNITKQQLTAWVYQFTASEIYLDGRLIQKYGVIDSNSFKTLAWSPVEQLFPLDLKPGVDHVIAVRLAYQSGIPYVSVLFIPLPAFSMYVNGGKAALINFRHYKHYTEDTAIIIACLAGVFLIISLIYLIYFIFDPNQKVNLYYFIFSTLLCLACIEAVPYYSNIDRISTQMWLGFSFAIIFIVSFLFLLLTIYSLYNYRSRAIFKILTLIGISGIGYLFFNDLWAYALCSNGFILLCLLEGGRVSIVAIKQRKKDAGIILIGIILGIILNIWAALLDQQTIFAQLMGCLSLLGFPLGMAFYLGLQNAMTNRKLKLMFIEVQTLSQEKQQILADQNEQLEQDVKARTAALNQSLSDLKSAQAQLIQSAKMASLGELTAGIAHEIQNPLNFVNNFSEVNIELLEELKQEISAKNYEEVSAIADDLIGNEQKINLHGKRADAIVKGMLQHSKASSGTKEPTNINSLADEYMRLAYHGLKAKDKTFSCEMTTNFDSKLPMINVIPQDIGRVMLNLFNNAFYAVHQKQKIAGDDYTPEVTAITYAENDHLIIRVKDNGTGIPDAVKDKIMQPFFTTKPTGEGTGLGLSLSYDIIKAHGGEIRIESKEGVGSEFTIQLYNK